VKDFGVVKKFLAI